MVKIPEIAFRTMEESDLDFATACTRDAGWLSESRDVFEAFLEHDPGGCFIVEADGNRAGICVATCYHENGFIGELVVVPDRRVLGLGRRLFTKALEYIESRQMTGIFLDGDLNAVPFYEYMGFRKICRSLRFKGRIDSGSRAGMRPMSAVDLDSICEIDRSLYGDDRGFFLRRRFQQFPRLCFVCETGGGKPGGYIMAHPAEQVLAVGPWAVWSGAVEPAGMLQHLAHQAKDPVLRVGVLEANSQASALFRSLPGLQETTHSWFMMRGDKAPPRLGLHPALYAVGSGAKG